MTKEAINSALPQIFFHVSKLSTIPSFLKLTSLSDLVKCVLLGKTCSSSRKRSPAAPVGSISSHGLDRLSPSEEVGIHFVSCSRVLYLWLVRLSSRRWQVTGSLNLLGSLSMFGKNTETINWSIETVCWEVSFGCFLLNASEMNLGSWTTLWPILHIIWWHSGKLRTASSKKTASWTETQSVWLFSRAAGFVAISSKTLWANSFHVFDGALSGSGQSVSNWNSATSCWRWRSITSSKSCV